MTTTCANCLHSIPSYPMVLDIPDSDGRWEPKFFCNVRCLAKWVVKTYPQIFPDPESITTHLLSQSSGCVYCAREAEAGGYD